MTETEINAELVLVDQAISAILQSGEEYETQSSSSSRRTKSVTLPELRKQRAYLQAELRELDGNSGLVIGY